MAVRPRSDWLERASRLHACPLCTEARRYESDYIGALCVRLVDEGGGGGAGVVVRELCAEHVTAFGRACCEAVAGVSAEMVLVVHVSRLEQLADRLSELEGDSWPIAPECALCLARNEIVLLCAHRLLAGLAGADSQVARWFAQAGGLCAGHFFTCWETSGDGEDREALRRVQLAVVQRLVDTARASAAIDELDACRVQTIAARATVITAT
jgi:hypothetical protein